MFIRGFMSTFTDERAAKIAGNLALPTLKTVEEFARELRTLGVDVTKATVDRTREALSLRGKAIETVSPQIKAIIEHRTDLAFIIDALGPKGENILTRDGITLIRAAELTQLELREFSSSFERLSKLDKNYQILLPTIKSGLEAFEGIVGIVESRKLEGGGELLRFDPEKSRDQRLEKTFLDYIDQWVQSGMGDPRLKGLSADEALLAVSNFPDADRRAFELSHPDQAGRVSGLSLGYSISAEFEKVAVVRGRTDDGRNMIYKGIDPGFSGQVATGPLDR